MVEKSAYIGMIIEIILGAGVPIALIIYFKAKNMLTWKALGVGILVYIVFSRILESAAHALLLDGNRLKFTDSPIAYAIYGALAAGIFEEIGRFIGFKWLLKGLTKFKEGLSYGLGHGGIESILVGAFAGVNAIVIANLINSGGLADSLGNQFTADQIQTLKETFINHGGTVYILGGIERIVAYIVQICLSLIVLLGVKEKAFKFVLLAIGLHALFDFFPALYQANVISSLWIVEVLIIIIGIIALFAIFKIKPLFEGKETEQ